MSVFTDAGECNINRRQNESISCLCPGLFTGAIQQKRTDNPSGFNKVLLNVSLHACGMLRPEINVFIQVKQCDLLPGDILLRNEKIQELELRASRGGDNSSGTASGNRVTNESRSVNAGRGRYAVRTIEDVLNHKIRQYG